MVDLQLLQSVSYTVGALGVGVAAIYYMVTLRVQQQNMKHTLQTRQAQMFMNIYDKLSSTQFNTAFEKVVLTQWSTWEEYRKLYSEKEFNEAANFLGNTYEGVGVLVREGLLDVRFVALLMCGMTRLFFERFQPILRDGRDSTGMSRWLSETEYLYGELIKYIGLHPELDTRIEKTIIDLPPQ